MRKRGIEDLIPSHGNLLVHLFGGEALTVTELAQRTGRTKSTISVLAGKLEKTGYLRREPDPADARLLRLRLTKKGEALEDAFAETQLKCTARSAKDSASRNLLYWKRFLPRALRSSIRNPTAYTVARLPMPKYEKGENYDGKLQIGFCSPGASYRTA